MYALHVRPLSILGLVVALMPMTPAHGLTTKAKSSPTQTSKAALVANSVTTSVALEKAVVEKKSEPARRFKLKYRTYNAMDLTTVEGVGTDGEVRAWDRINATYKLTDEVSISVMPQLYHTWWGSRTRGQDASVVGLGDPYSFYWGNTGLILGHSELLKSDSGITVDGFVRYDIPTSEVSQMNDSSGEGWAYLNIKQSLGKFEVAINETFRYYFQKYTSSRLTKNNPLVENSNLPVQNLNYRAYTLLDLTYNFTSKFSVLLETGMLFQGRYADATTGRSAIYTSNIIFNPEMTYSFTDNVSATLGVFEMPGLEILDTRAYTPLEVTNGGEAYFMLTLKI